MEPSLQSEKNRIIDFKRERFPLGSKHFQDEKASDEPHCDANRSPTRDSGRYKRWRERRSKDDEPCSRREGGSLGRPCRAWRDSSSSCSSDCSSDSEDRLSLRRPSSRHEKLIDLLDRVKFQKEVVSPGVFDGKDGSSLRRFLTEFEAYFHAKYEGNERQQAKKLGEFLDGPPLRAYQAVEGSRVKYTYLKMKLLEWFRGEKQSQRSRSEGEFEKATMLHGDTLQIFALRLERMAELAFPDSRRERERLLCRKFKREVPANFHKVLTDSERHLALIGKKSRLDWTTMLQLATAEDRHVKEQVIVSDDDQGAVWFSRPSNPSREGAAIPNRGPRYRTTYNNSNRSPPPRGNMRDNKTPLTCQWCGKRSHTEQGCWLKAGLCLACGSKEHSVDACPKRTADDNREKPQCSICGGPHLGKDCTATLNHPAPM